MQYATPQEEFWAGDFGDEYISRNDLTESNLAMYLAKWSRITPCLSVAPASILEFGANIGLNLRALNTLFPQAKLSGVEINAKAADLLKKWGENAGKGRLEVHNQSIFDFQPAQKYDLVFTSVVLIHIDPEHLPLVYQKMYESSSRYIVVSEYYNSTPTQVTYRGHTERLYKRDFAGELMQAYPDLVLTGYGFLYQRDPHFNFGDYTWFVLEKRLDLL